MDNNATGKLRYPIRRWNFGTVTVFTDHRNRNCRTVRHRDFRRGGGSSAGLGIALCGSTGSAGYPGRACSGLAIAAAHPLHCTAQLPVGSSRVAPPPSPSPSLPRSRLRTAVAAPPRRWTSSPRLRPPPAPPAKAAARKAETASKRGVKKKKKKEGCWEQGLVAFAVGAVLIAIWALYAHRKERRRGDNVDANIEQADPAALATARLPAGGAAAVNQHAISLRQADTDTVVGMMINPDPPTAHTQGPLQLLHQHPCAPVLPLECCCARTLATPHSCLTRSHPAPRTTPIRVYCARTPSHASYDHALSPPLRCQLLHPAPFVLPLSQKDNPYCG